MQFYLTLIIGGKDGGLKAIQWQLKIICVILVGKTPMMDGWGKRCVMDICRERFKTDKNQQNKII